MEVREGSGMIFDRKYTTSGIDVYDMFDWTKKRAEIKNVDGSIQFELDGIDAPSEWAQQPLNIVASKYFFKGNGKEYVEKSIGGLTKRVVDSISNEGVKQEFMSKEESEKFGSEMAYGVLTQRFAFNSPVWFNVGLSSYGVSGGSLERSHWAYDYNGGFTNNIQAYERPQTSACFIQSIEDNMESILEHAKKEGMLFKFGSGTGTNFSPLRGVYEPLSGGGVASGEISFMRIYDIIASRVKSGGKTRRAAQMVIQNDDHPDLIRFLYWKINEEKKALWLSAMPQWGPKFPGDLECEAYQTVDGQNGNNTVRLGDGFMIAASKNADWDLNYRTANRADKEVKIPLEDYMDDPQLPDKRFLKSITNKRKVVNAGEVFDLISRAAAINGDPGVQFDSTINKWHTCPNSGRINASNPCSEFMFLDDTACNLASVNVKKYQVDAGIFDANALKHDVRMVFTAQDILIDNASYPSRKIAENSHSFRPIGLGHTNIASLLMSKGIAYNSDKGRAIISTFTSLMQAYAAQTSAELASIKGTFEEYEKNKEPMLKVMEMHREHAHKIPKMDGLEELVELSNREWDRAIEMGKEHGYRNAQFSVLAPTGTIGFMMDVDVTGIEPMLALVAKKGLAGGGEMKIDVKDCVKEGLTHLGYGDKLEDILKYIRKNNTVVGAPHIDEKHYDIFQTAYDSKNSVSVDGHLEAMAVAQPFISGSISKTVNLPKGSTPKDIRETYEKAWKLGLKSVCPYIDGSKGIQPVNVLEILEGKNPKWGEKIKPDSPNNVKKWNVDIGPAGVILMVGEYDVRPANDSPAEFFALFGSSGSQYSAAYESIMKPASRLRQSGESIEDFIKHNKGARGSINGVTNHPHIKMCSSIEDFFAKLVQLEYLGDTRISGDGCVCDNPLSPEEIAKLRCNELGQLRREQHYKSRIAYIDSIMERGEVIEIFPLFQDEIKKGSMSMGVEFCDYCGSGTVPSGANCRKCLNCGDASGCG